jgi:hypothetical protein
MSEGRANKVLKLTPAKVKYIILAKTNNISSRIIANEVKVSIRTVSHVWSHWMKNKDPWAPKDQTARGHLALKDEVCFGPRAPLNTISF